MRHAVREIFVLYKSASGKILYLIQGKYLLFSLMHNELNINMYLGRGNL